MSDVEAGESELSDEFIVIAYGAPAQGARSNPLVGKHFYLDVSVPSNEFRNFIYINEEIHLGAPIAIKWSRINGVTQNPIATGMTYFRRDLIQTVNLGDSPKEKLISEFNERAERWENETAIHSSPGATYLHRDYMAIISRGAMHKDIIIPLILSRLFHRGGDWFFALEAIAGENPAKDCEDYRDALRAWEGWAIQHRLITESNALSAA